MPDSGYTERDVREQARALTGFDNDWKRGAGNVNFRYDRERHDGGSKRIFGKSGAFDWQDAVRLCLHHPKHAPFFVDKLWHYFIPVAPDAGTRRSLEAMYRKNYEIRPIVDAILRHPALYTGPRMVKPPAVYTAGLLRGIGRGIDTHLVGVARVAGPASASSCRRTSPAGTTSAGSTPPRSAGAGGSRTTRASRTRSPTSRRPSCPPSRRRSSKPRSSSGAPPRCARPRAPRCLTFANRAMGDANAKWKQTSYRFLTANALRQLIAVSPDLQTS